jgi:hypothetical protein
LLKSIYEHMLSCACSITRWATQLEAIRVSVKGR